MKTAFYTVALGAAMAAHGIDGVGSRGGPGLHSRSQVRVRGHRARRGTRSCVLTGAHERALRGLFVKAVEGYWVFSECKADIQHFCPTATLATLPTV